MNFPENEKSAAPPFAEIVYHRAAIERAISEIYRMFALRTRCRGTCEPQVGSRDPRAAPRGLVTHPPRSHRDRLATEKRTSSSNAKRPNIRIRIDAGSVCMSNRLSLAGYAACSKSCSRRRGSADSPLKCSTSHRIPSMSASATATIPHATAGTRSAVFGRTPPVHGMAGELNHIWITSYSRFGATRVPRLARCARPRPCARRRWQFSRKRLDPSASHPDFGDRPRLTSARDTTLRSS